MKGRKKRAEMKIWGRGKLNGILKTFKKCRKCGTTEEIHYAEGLCIKCYQKRFQSTYERKDKEKRREQAKVNYYKKKNESL